MYVATNLWCFFSAVQEIPQRCYYRAGEEDRDGCQIHERKCLHIKYSIFLSLIQTQSQYERWAWRPWHQQVVLDITFWTINFNILIITSSLEHRVACYVIRNVYQRLSLDGLLVQIITVQGIFVYNNCITNLPKSQTQVESSVVLMIWEEAQQEATSDKHLSRGLHVLHVATL